MLSRILVRSSSKARSRLSARADGPWALFDDTCGNLIQVAERQCCQNETSTGAVRS